jgi:hypothetical protein
MIDGSRAQQQKTKQWQQQGNHHSNDSVFIVRYGHQFALRISHWLWQVAYALVIVYC